MPKLGTERTQKVLLEYLNAIFRAKGKSSQGLLTILTCNVTFQLYFKELLLFVVSPRTILGFYLQLSEGRKKHVVYYFFNVKMVFRL